MTYKFKVNKWIPKFNMWLVGYGRTKDRARKHLKAQVNRYRTAPLKMVGKTSCKTIARCDLIHFLNLRKAEEDKKNATKNK